MPTAISGNSRADIQGKPLVFCVGTAAVGATVAWATAGSAAAVTAGSVAACVVDTPEAVSTAGPVPEEAARAEVSPGRPMGQDMPAHRIYPFSNQLKIRFFSVFGIMSRMPKKSGEEPK